MGTWQTVDATFPIATCEYSFGRGLANSLAVGIDGGIAIVSPPCKVDESVYAAAEQLGPVKALVASNAYHHLGLPEWKRRFPGAKLYAPAQSVARVSKQSKLAGIAPLSELEAGPNVDLLDMPHYRSGEVLVRARTPNGGVWYTTDILMNMPVVPKGILGKVFGWTGSAPGFKFNNVASFLMVKDRPGIKRWLLQIAEQEPPKLVVACHGPVITLGDPLGELRSAISA